MTKNGVHQPLTVQLQADKPVIPAGKAGARILEINLTATGTAQERSRVPLNLALVIDRSGSMHGEKLHFVKEAAAHVIDLLTEQDRAAVVIYDNQVETLMSSQFITDNVKREAKAKIRKVQSGGSTYLYGGWLAGCREAAEAIGKSTINRTLLLTDGLANVGVRDVAAISIHAQELFTRHVATSCFGVGVDYDEHMLESIANHGGGNFHFLETTNAIPLVFEREFDEIISISLKDVRVVLDLPVHATAKVSANWRSEQEGNRLTIFLGSLVAEQTQSLYLQLSGLNGSGTGQVTIPVKVVGVDLDQVEHIVEATLTFALVSADQEAAQAADPGLMERFALVDLADQATEALKRERAGDRRGSSRLMQDALSLHKEHINNSTTLRYERMANEMNEGYNALERKRRHFNAYQSKRGWQSIRDYRLNFGTGLPLAEIEDRVVLIHTGSPTSIADEPVWSVLDEVYAFKPEFNGLTCQQLSQVLGTRIDVMLGMDILGELHVRLNANMGVIQLSRQPFRSSGVRLAIDDVNGLPATQLTVGGEDVTLRLVSALKLNYLPDKIVTGLNQVGDAKDAFPGSAAFTTPIYKLPLLLGRHGLTLNCGVVSDNLQVELALKPGEDVLGADLLQSVPVTLAFPAGELFLYV